MGDENVTDANGLLLPAWLLRNKIEDKWIKEFDVRVRVYSGVLLDSIVVTVLGQKVTGHYTERPFMGVSVTVKFCWQGWSKASPDSCRPEPFFKHHAARDVEAAHMRE